MVTEFTHSSSDYSGKSPLAVSALQTGLTSSWVSMKFHVDGGSTNNVQWVGRTDSENRMKYDLRGVFGYI